MYRKCPCGTDLQQSFLQKQFQKGGRLPNINKLFCSLSPPPTPCPSCPALRSPRQTEALERSKVYCFWNSFGISREKDDPLPYPSSILSTVPTYFPGAVHKSPFGVWEGKENSKVYSQIHTPFRKGKWLPVEEYSKRNGQGKTEVECIQLYTPNITFFLSLAMSLQVHVT